jgi:C-terminal processing protease CtpA/Prc
MRLTVFLSPFGGSLRLVFAGFMLLSLSQLALAQTPTKFDIDRGRGMLQMIRNELKKNYYDPSFRGIDIEGKFKAADEQLKQATSNSQIFWIIAQVILELDDSHTIFVPPRRSTRVEYGWQMQMIGQSCYVTSVKPGSDAEAKGLKVGDQILLIGDNQPTRQNLWIINYLIYAITPQLALNLKVKSTDGTERQFEVQAALKEGKLVRDLTSYNEVQKMLIEAQSENRLHRHRTAEVGDELLIWKMPAFDLPIEKVDAMIDKARKHKSLILDLRGNGGGSEETLLRLVANLFDRDINIGELKRRKESKPLKAKTRGKNIFTGQLVVLVDSKSGSAAELLARIIQLEKRGQVLGDQTPGHVMRAVYFPLQVGVQTVALFGLSVTDADLIMSDGRSLEKVGITPDKVMLPTAADLAAKRDPVLTRAAELLGVKLEPEKAGSFFPIEWLK